MNRKMKMSLSPFAALCNKSCTPFLYKDRGLTGTHEMRYSSTHLTGAAMSPTVLTPRRANKGQ